MTSVHSQPIQTISFTDYDPSVNQTFKPKFIHLHDEQKLNKTIDTQPKKLPFNLFLSATEYNKMLITNGKNRKRKTPQILDGLITSLEYMNDPIFQKQIQKRSKLKQTQKVEVKHEKKQSKSNFKCSCNYDSCEQCIKNPIKCVKLAQSEVKRGKSIDYQTIVDKPKKYSINHRINNKKPKFIKDSRRARSSFDKTQKNKKSVNEQNIMSKSRGHKNPDISHLLIKSLIEFTQQKKAEKIYQASIQRTKSAKEEYLKLLNEQIRTYNMQASRKQSNSKSKSRNRSKSLTTKHQLSLNYWERIKDQVLNSLKNDNYSHPLKAQLLNYSLNVYDHKQLPLRKPRLSNRQIQYLRQVRASQAKETIQRQIKSKKEKQIQIQRNLKSLEKERKQRISQTSKKPFRPTANMIQSAFQNFVEPTIKDSKKDKHEKGRHASSIFMNQGIRTMKLHKK